MVKLQTAQFSDQQESGAADLAIIARRSPTSVDYLLQQCPGQSVA